MSEYKSACHHRHNIVKELDQPLELQHLPRRGEVRIFVTSVVDATHYYAWVLEHSDSDWDSTSGARVVHHTELHETMLAMNAHFETPGNYTMFDGPDVPSVGQIYALEVETNHFRRVQVCRPAGLLT